MFKWLKPRKDIKRRDVLGYMTFVFFATLTISLLADGDMATIAPMIAFCLIVLSLGCVWLWKHSSGWNWGRK